MALLLPKPILYLITRGATNKTTTAVSEEFQNILMLVSAAVAAGIELIQLREKQLTARVLFELTGRAAEVASGTPTRVLVNDRADIAASAGADGVHLARRSLDANVIRKSFGGNFLIGASTHSLAEARAARNSGADFVVFGPVFETASKEKYGPPVGIQSLARVSRELAPFPALAIGGISTGNAQECLRAGGSGIAAITLFSEPTSLRTTAEIIRQGAGIDSSGGAK